MSKEVLERALNRTNKLEEDEQKKMRVAEIVGKTLGVSVALAVDALVIWAVLNFMISYSIGYLPILGGLILVQLAAAKFRVWSSS